MAEPAVAAAAAAAVAAAEFAAAAAHHSTAGQSHREHEGPWQQQTEAGSGCGVRVIGADEPWR